MRIRTGVGDFSIADVNPLFRLGADAQQSYNDGFLGTFAQWLGVKDNPSMPRPSAPVFNAPVAPQTEYAMTHWTPDWLTEGLYQRQVQSDRDIAYQRKVANNIVSEDDIGTVASDKYGVLPIILMIVGGIVVIKVMD